MRSLLCLVKVDVKVLSSFVEVPTFNPSRAAVILTDAMLTTDEKASELHGVSVRTIRNYRVRLHSDPHFAAFFLKVKKAKESDWVADLPEAIASGIKFLKRAADEASHQHPDVIVAVAGGLKILADIDITRKIVDAQLQESQSLATAESAYLNEGIAESTVDTTSVEVTD